MANFAGFYDISLSVSEAAHLLEKMAAVDNLNSKQLSSYLNMPFGLVGESSSATNSPQETLKHIEVCFDGIITNVEEIKKELPTPYFKEENTTEEHLAKVSYLHWGSDFIKKLTGEFVVAIWDKKQEILFCGRDPLGIKTFHYLHEHHCFYFGCSIHQVKCSPSFNGQFNLEQVSKGIHLGFNHFMDETFYQQIKLLPPGCSLTLENNKVSIKSYATQQDTIGLKSTPISDDRNRPEVQLNSIKENFIALNVQSPIPILSAKYLYKFSSISDTDPNKLNVVANFLQFDPMLHDIGQAADLIKMGNFRAAWKLLKLVSQAQNKSIIFLLKSSIRLASTTTNSFYNAIYHNPRQLLYDNANWFKLSFSTTSIQEQMDSIQRSVYPIGAELYENTIISQITGASFSTSDINHYGIKSSLNALGEEIILEDELLNNQLDFLLTTKLSLPSGFNTPKALKIIELYKNGNRSLSQLVWRIVCVNYWISVNKS